MNKLSLWSLFQLLKISFFGYSLGIQKLKCKLNIYFKETIIFRWKHFHNKMKSDINLFTTEFHAYFWKHRYRTEFGGTQGLILPSFTMWQLYYSPFYKGQVEFSHSLKSVISLSHTKTLPSVSTGPQMSLTHSKSLQRYHFLILRHWQTYFYLFWLTNISGKISQKLVGCSMLLLFHYSQRKDNGIPSCKSFPLS